MFISLHRKLSWNFSSSYLISSLMLNYYEKQYKLNKMAKVQAERILFWYTHQCSIGHRRYHTQFYYPYNIRFSYNVSIQLTCIADPPSCSFILSRCMNVYPSWHSSRI